jgi:hypothetical protein
MAALSLAHATRIAKYNYLKAALNKSEILFLYSRHGFCQYLSVTART